VEVWLVLCLDGSDVLGLDIGVVELVILSKPLGFGLFTTLGFREKFEKPFSVFNLDGNCLSLLVFGEFNCDPVEIGRFGNRTYFVENLGRLNFFPLLFFTHKNLFLLRLLKNERSCLVRLPMFVCQLHLCCV